MRWNRDRFLAALGVAAVKVLAATWRVTLRDDGGLYNADRDTPLVVLLWHNRILAAVLGEWKCRAQRRRLTVLTSASRDGGILAEFVGRFGMDAIRGSTSRRGAGALRELRRLLASGRDVVLTPDGPRGPMYDPSLGALFLARNAGMPLVAMRVEVSRAWRLKTWDRFFIPKPFSTIHLHTQAPRIPPPLLSAGETATENAAQLEADKAFLRQLLQTEAGVRSDDPEAGGGRGRLSHASLQTSPKP